MDKENIVDTDKLKIENGTFIFTRTDLDSISRKIELALLTVAGEDLQAQEKGLDLQGILFNEKSSVSDIYSEISRVVLSIDEIQELVDMQISQDKETRNVLITYKFDGETITSEFAV